MAGNSQRRGAVRRAGSKKGATAGTGGKNRGSLEGRGPTPKARDRPGHPAYRAPGSSSGPVRTRQNRGRDAAQLVVGRNAVVEALRGGVPGTELLLAVGMDPDERVREAVRRSQEHGLRVTELPRPELDRRADGLPSQGIALRVAPYDYLEPEQLLARATKTHEPALVVALDGVTDPRNLGAIIRSAAAFGSHGVLVPERRSAQLTAATWKSSAGAAARLPVARTVNLARALRTYRSAGVFVVGLDGGGDTQVDQIPVADEPVVLVAGSEGRGLSRVVQAECDVVARVPLRGGVESLNASVAVGIALYAVALARAE